MRLRICPAQRTRGVNEREQAARICTDNARECTDVLTLSYSQSRFHALLHPSVRINLRVI